MQFIKRMLTFRLRKKRRFKAREGLYIFLGNSLTPNQVYDINMRGLSYYYVDQGINPGKGSRQLTLVTRNNLLVAKLPYETVSDFESAEIMFQNKRIKRRSVRFGKLSFSQKSKLKDTLKKFT